MNKRDKVITIILCIAMFSLVVASMYKGEKRLSIVNEYCLSKGWDNSNNDFNGFYCYKRVLDDDKTGYKTIKSSYFKFDDIKEIKNGGEK